MIGFYKGEAFPLYRVSVFNEGFWESFLSEYMSKAFLKSIAIMQCFMQCLCSVSWRWREV